MIADPQIRGNIDKKQEVTVQVYHKGKYKMCWERVQGKTLNQTLEIKEGFLGKVTFMLKFEESGLER